MNIENNETNIISNVDNDLKNTKPTEIHFLNTQELLKGLITKHTKLLDTYKLKFSEIDEKMQLLSSGIDSANKNKEATINRIEVLKEKSFQLYHQISSVLEDLSDFNGIDNKLLHSINDKIVKLERSKSLLDIDETKQSIDEIKSLVSKLMIETPQSRELVSIIIARLDDALEAKCELVSIYGNDEEFDKDAKKQSIALKGITSKQEWLKNRIEQHKKAFEYWSLKLKEFETMDISRDINE